MDNLHSTVLWIQTNWSAMLIGAIASRPLLCADLVFRAIMASPFRPLFLRAAPTFLAWADEFEGEIARDIAEEKAKDPGGDPRGR